MLEVPITMSVANVITSVLTDTSEYVQVVEPEGAAYREPAAGSRTQTLDVGNTDNEYKKAYFTN